MLYFYLLYSLCFVVIFVGSTVHTLSPVRLFPRWPCALLSLFALFHGLFEVVKLLQKIEESGVSNASPDWLDRSGIFLLPVSFLFLLAFGVELLIQEGRKTWSLRFVYAGVLALTITLFFYINSNQPNSPLAWIDSLELASRLGMGSVGGLFAALATWSLGRRYASMRQESLAKLLRFTAAGFIMYGIASGLMNSPMTPGAPLPEHGLTVSPNLIVFRAVIILATTAVLMQALFIEMGRMNFMIEKMREDFSLNVAHEMRNLINRISISSELLLDAGKVPDIDHGKLLEMLGKSARRLNRLVSDLLETSLIDQYQFKLDLRSDDLATVLRSAFTNARSIMHLPNFSTNLPDRPVLAYIDAHRIEQIIMNLLGNVEKYSDRTRPISVDFKVVDGQARISVSSWGAPIPPDEAELLFNRFYRSKLNRKQAKGTGLGLSIVKGLVESHGGQVNASSDENGLTTFSFTIPLKTAVKRD